MSKRERKYLIAGALVLLAIILVVGGVMYFKSVIQPANQLVYDTISTRAKAAGETAVYEGILTRQADS